jgi:hypothetical protein
MRVSGLRVYDSSPNLTPLVQTQTLAIDHRRYISSLIANTLLTFLPGVVLLHLLFIPGVAFLTGGARIWEQNLHPHPTQLNHTLLTIGCVISRYIVRTH